MSEQHAISADDPMFDQVESVDFSAMFCFTGEFAFGDRKACEHATAALGGVIKKRPVKFGKCYLVVGTLSNPDWTYASAGRKILDAQYAKKFRCEMFIIHEDVWANALVDCQAQAPERSLLRFVPPHPVKKVYFLQPPEDIAALRIAIEEAGAEVFAQFRDRVDLLVVPDGVGLSSLGTLYAFPGVGPITVEKIQQAMDKGLFMVSESGFRSDMLVEEKPLADVPAESVPEVCGYQAWEGYNPETGEVFEGGNEEDESSESDKESGLNNWRAGLRVLWQGQEKIRFSYCDKDEHLSKRNVIVTAVWGGKDAIVYFLGHCLLRNEQRTFKFNRIQSKIFLYGDGSEYEPYAFLVSVLRIPMTELITKTDD